MQSPPLALAIQRPKLLREGRERIGQAGFVVPNPMLVAVARHNSSAAADLVFDMLAASGLTRSSCKVQMTLFSAGSLNRVTPSLTIRASHRICAPCSRDCRAAATNPGEKCTNSSSPTMPAAWIIRTATCSSSGLNRARSASARILAKLCL